MYTQNTALLGAYIRILREAKEWSLRDLASAAGISHTTIDNIEKGYDPRTGRTTNITLDTLGHIAEALEVPGEHLLACLNNTARVTLERPVDTWHEDEREDMERERGGICDYLKLKWGRGKIDFPTVMDDEAAAKRFLFGAHTPTDAAWQQVVQFANLVAELYNH